MIRQSRLANFALLLLATLLFTVFISDDSEAATLTVDKFGGSDYTNITQAVDNASAADTIRVASRTYHDAVDIDKRLTVIGGNYGSDIGNIYDCNDGGLSYVQWFTDHSPGLFQSGRSSKVALWIGNVRMCCRLNFGLLIICASNLVHYALTKI